VTYLEAIVRDRPVIAYDPPAGHARRIAKVLTDRGRQWLATGPEQVPSTLLAAFDPCARGTVARAWPPSAASVVLSASARVLPRPPWHASALRVAAIVVLVTLLSGVTFFVDDSYSVLAKTLHLQSARPAAVDSTSVVLVIRSSSRAVPHAVAELENHGQSASFVFADARTPVALDAIAHSNDQLLPALELNPRTGWPHLRRYLKEQVAEATGGSFVYLPPRDGFTLSEYLLARSAGALPLSGATWLDLRGLVAGRAMKHGSVLVVDVESKTTGSPDLLRSVLDELSHRHLKAVPVGFGAEPVRSSVKARAA
ncbi:MAG: hypothetical protein M1274_14755, partial [Actinobacteria bacterium]|nr:hypothetical protein [Actinomycetota bacterium]